jgi:hypothetical protein
VKRLVVVLAALVLAACQLAPPLPEVVTSVKTVPTPYPVACVKAGSAPPLPPAPVLAVDADIAQRAAWARIRMTQLRQHDITLQAILVGCTTQEVIAP